MYFMNVLANINPFILFLVFLMFGVSVITFAFALTPFFHKPKVIVAPNQFKLVVFYRILDFVYNFIFGFVYY